MVFIQRYLHRKMKKLIPMIFCSRMWEDRPVDHIEFQQRLWFPSFNKTVNIKPLYKTFWPPLGSLYRNYTLLPYQKVTYCICIVIWLPYKMPMLMVPESFVESCPPAACPECFYICIIRPFTQNVISDSFPWIFFSPTIYAFIHV